MNYLKRYKIETVVLLILSVVILFPPIAYGYIYPNISDDTAEHLQFFELMKAGIYPSEIYPGLYYGQVFTGTIINTISDLTRVSANMLFLWFNFATLIAVATTMLIIFRRLINKWTGIILPIILLFTSYGTISLFEHGIIFNVINMYIILPIMLYFMVMWLTNKGKINFLLAILFAIIFLVFHLSSLYLIPMFLSGIAILSGYYIIKKEYKRLLTATLLATSVILISLLAIFISPYTDRIIPIIMKPSTISPPTIMELMTVYISPIVIMLLFLALALVKNKKNIILAEQTKITLLILFGFSIPLAFGSFTEFAYDPTRIAFDLAGILVIIMVIIIGISIENFSGKWNKLYKAICISIILIGTLPVISLWFSYSSSIQPADIMAINYLNSRSNSSYSSDSFTAAHIYSRYISQSYIVEGVPDYYIKRSKPMTPRTDPDNYWFVQKEEPDLKTLNKITEFNDGKTIVWILERTKVEND